MAEIKPMRVLIAVDDMTYGQAIANFVASHKWTEGTQFKIIHAVHIDELTYVTNDQFSCSLAKDLIEERDRRARSLVKGLAAQIQAAFPTAKIEEQIIFGKAKDVILDQADEWHADIIVVGSHGKSGISRFLLGSVSQSVLSHAPCSVMIVKLPKETAAEDSETKAATKTEQSDQAVSSKTKK